MRKNITRILIGLLTVFLIGRLAAWLIYPSLGTNGGYSAANSQEYAVRMVAIGSLIEFFSIAVGGFIAREKFLIPAIAYVGVYLAYGWYVTLSSLAASGQLHLEMVPYLLLPGLINVPVGVAGALAGMKLFAMIGTHREFVGQYPKWAARYRYYLYFALILSLVGLLLSFTVFGGSFRFAVVNIAIAVFVLSSLNRFGEKRITIVHLVFNAATLLSAAVSLGIGGERLWPSQSFWSIQSLLSVIGADLDALTSLVHAVSDALNNFGFGEYELSGGLSLTIGGIALAFGILSAYWLWNLYQLMSTPRDGEPIGGQLAQRSDDRVTSSWTKGRAAWYVAMPFIVLFSVAALVVFVPVGLAEATGATPFMIFTPMAMQFSTELIFVGAVLSVYRICKIVI